MKSLESVNEEALTLFELVSQARIADSQFNDKYVYWTEVRGKTPDFEWIMDNLRSILGDELLKLNAEKIVAVKESLDESDSDM